MFFFSHLKIKIKIDTNIRPQVYRFRIAAQQSVDLFSSLETKWQ